MADVAEVAQPQQTAWSSKHFDAHSFALPGGAVTRSRSTRRTPSLSYYDSKTQRRVHHLIGHPVYELVLVAAVIFNVALMVIDLDSSLSCNADESCTAPWLAVAENVLLGIYTLDLAAGIFAERLIFFNDAMHWLDLAIVLLGYVEVAIVLVAQAEAAMLNLIRIFRLCRLLRLAKLLRPIPELHRLVVGFVFTVRAIFWGFVMLLLLCLVWSIIILQSVSLIETDNLFDDARFGEYWCKDAVGSTWNMMLLLWQTMITGDSWGACTLPIILREPSMYIVFAAAFVCVSIGFTNLILAVIVENANEKSEEDRLIAKLEMQIEAQAAIAKYQNAFCSLDVDESGTLSLDELLAGYDHDDDLQNSLLMKFGIDRSDLTELLSSFDLQCAGEVPYDEMIKAMFRSQRQEPSAQLMMIHSAVSKLTAVVRDIERTVLGGQQQLQESIRNVQAHYTSTSLHASNRDYGTSDCALNTSANVFLDKCAADVGQLQIESLESRLQNISRALQQHGLDLVEETRALTATLTQLTNQQPSWRPGEASGSLTAQLVPTAEHPSNCLLKDLGHGRNVLQTKDVQSLPSANTVGSCSNELEQSFDERILV